MGAVKANSVVAGRYRSDKNFANQGGKRRVRLKKTFPDEVWDRLRYELLSTLPKVPEYGNTDFVHRDRTLIIAAIYVLQRSFIKVSVASASARAAPVSVMYE